MRRKGFREVSEEVLTPCPHRRVHRAPENLSTPAFLGTRALEACCQ
jgi:hypothetical protein